MPKKTYLLDLIQLLSRTHATASFSRFLCSKRVKELTDEEYEEFFHMILMEKQLGEEKVMEILSLYSGENFNLLEPEKQEKILAAIKRSDTVEKASYIAEIANHWYSSKKPGLLGFVNLIETAVGSSQARHIVNITWEDCHNSLKNKLDENKLLKLGKFIATAKGKVQTAAGFDLVTDSMLLEAPNASELVAMVTESELEDGIPLAAEYIQRALRKIPNDISYNERKYLFNRISTIASKLTNSVGTEQAECTFNYIKSINYGFEKSKDDNEIETMESISREENVKKIKDIKRLIEHCSEKSHENIPELVKILLSVESDYARSKVLEIIYSNEIFATGLTLSLARTVADSKGIAQAYSSTILASNANVLASGAVFEITAAVANTNTNFQANSAEAVAKNKDVLAREDCVGLISLITEPQVAEEENIKYVAQLLQNKIVLSLDYAEIRRLVEKMLAAKKGKEYNTYMDILESIGATETRYEDFYEVLEKNPELAIISITKSRITDVTPGTKIKIRIPK